MDEFILAGQSFKSRLIVGTGKYSSKEQLKESIKASGAQIATMAIKRVEAQNTNDNILEPLKQLNITLMPNTSGARDAKEAVYAANLSKEALGTNWVKVEVHPDQKYLMPDPIETYNACKTLKAQGFEVFAYIHADPTLAKALDELKIAAIMPLGSPIGSAKGLASEEFLKIIINECKTPIIIDAGIGTPSDAALAMELGADAIMVNTAIAAATDCINMAKAFDHACIAGRIGYLSGLVTSSNFAMPTSPLEAFLQEAMK